jgi:hypothetical protein
MEGSCQTVRVSEFNKVAQVSTFASVQVRWSLSGPNVNYHTRIMSFLEEFLQLAFILSRVDPNCSLKLLLFNNEQFFKQVHFLAPLLRIKDIFQLE